MRVLYDTRTVSEWDRYEYYRHGAASELAPVEVRGREPGRMLAAMSSGRAGEFEFEELTWAADAEVTTHRTERLIRRGDPGRFRLIAPTAGEIRLEQAGHRERLRPGDVALYDLSRPWRAAHPPGPGRIGVVMLTFPRSRFGVALDDLAGTRFPRSLPGRELMAQLLTALPATSHPDAETLAGCAEGLLRRRLGDAGAVTPELRRMVYLARVRDAARALLADPDLDPERLARAVAISPRYLHKLFAGTGVTPMQLVKRLRLEAGRRLLAGPPGARTVTVGQAAAAVGYRRADQFARDFHRAFGVAPSRVGG